MTADSSAYVAKYLRAIEAFNNGDVAAFDLAGLEGSGVVVGGTADEMAAREPSRCASAVPDRE